LVRKQFFGKDTQEYIGDTERRWGDICCIAVLFCSLLFSAALPLASVLSATTGGVNLDCL